MESGDGCDVVDFDFFGCNCVSYVMGVCVWFSGQ